MRDKLFRKFLFPFYHRVVRRDGLLEQIAFFSKSQWWGREAIAEYQWSEFKRLLAHAYENVPYYHTMFVRRKLRPEDIRSREDLVLIPLLTKNIIREYKEELIARNIPRERLTPNSTSGTSGESLHFYSDRQQEVRKMAMQERAYEWMGFSPGQKQLWIWGARFDVDKTKKIIPRIKEIVRAKKMLSSYNLGEKGMAECLDVMNSFKPKLIGAYPSHLYHIARHMKEIGCRYKADCVVVSGEKLYDFQREAINEVFETEVFDYYGARDGSVIAQECGEHKGLHIFTENVLLEVVDEGVQGVTGETGEIVLTDLGNYAMPFIRYRIGDLGRVSDRICPCGRGLPLLEEVIGRTFDLIKFPNGNVVGGTFWTLLIKSIKEIRKFKVIQKKIDDIEILYVPDELFSEDVLGVIRAKILEHSGPLLTVRFIMVDDIQNTQAGKFQFVHSEV